MYFMKYKSQKIQLILPKSAVTLNTPVTLTEHSVPILLGSLLREAEMCISRCSFITMGWGNEGGPVREWFEGYAWSWLPG